MPAGGGARSGKFYPRAFTWLPAAALDLADSCRSPWNLAALQPTSDALGSLARGDLTRLDDLLPVKVYTGLRVLLLPLQPWACLEGPP